jgi:hypothetical protein
VFAGAGAEVVKIPPRSPRERVRRAVGAHRTDRVPGLAADLERSAPAPALTAYLAHYNRAVRIGVWAWTCRYQCLARGWSADVAA